MLLFDEGSAGGEGNKPVAPPPVVPPQPDPSSGDVKGPVTGEGEGAGKPAVPEENRYRELSRKLDKVMGAMQSLTETGSDMQSRLGALENQQTPQQQMENRFPEARPRQTPPQSQTVVDADEIAEKAATAAVNQVRAENEKEKFKDSAGKFTAAAMEAYPDLGVENSAFRDTATRHADALVANGYRGADIWLRASKDAAEELGVKPATGQRPSPQSPGPTVPRERASQGPPPSSGGSVGTLDPEQVRRFGLSPAEQEVAAKMENVPVDERNGHTFTIDDFE